MKEDYWNKNVFFWLVLFLENECSYASERGSELTNERTKVCENQNQCNRT